MLGIPLVCAPIRLDMPVQFETPVARREYITWTVLFALILAIGIALSVRRGDVLDYVQAVMGAIGVTLAIAKRRNMPRSAR